MRPTVLLLLVLEMILPFVSGLGFSKYSKEALRAHNKRRDVPLKLDSELCKDAQAHADTMARKDGLSYHNINDIYQKGQGENLHFEWGLFNGIGSAREVPAEEAVKAWYDEKFTGAVCMVHAVQALWKSSQKFCQVRATSRTGKTYTVARYYPRVCHDVWQCVGDKKQKTYEQNIEPGFRLPPGC